MEENIKKRPVLSCAIIFMIGGAARLIEYFCIRTDETILSENFIHKVFGIIIHYNLTSAFPYISEESIFLYCSLAFTIALNHVIKVGTLRSLHLFLASGFDSIDPSKFF